MKKAKYWVTSAKLDKKHFEGPTKLQILVDKLLKAKEKDRKKKGK